MPRRRDDRVAIWDIINSADLISRLISGVDLGPTIYPCFARRMTRLN